MNQLTKKQRKALEEFAELKFSIEELRSRLRGVLEFDFKDHERRLIPHYRDPEPAIRIELKHIKAAMDKHRKGAMTTEELADWATMLLLNQAYDWQGPQEEEIATWLNEISMLTLKSKAEADPGH
jgi:hypothetical protein